MSLFHVTWNTHILFFGFRKTQLNVFFLITTGIMCKMELEAIDIMLQL